MVLYCCATDKVINQRLKFFAAKFHLNIHCLTVLIWILNPSQSAEVSEADFCLCIVPGKTIRVNYLPLVQWS